MSEENRKVIRDYYAKRAAEKKVYRETTPPEIEQAITEEILCAAAALESIANSLATIAKAVDELKEG